MHLRLVHALALGAVLSGIVVAQDRKPDDGKPKGKTFEGTVAGRKVSLTLQEKWTEYKPGAVPELPADAAPWKLVGAWKSGEFEELTLRLFGVEKAGVNATKVRDAWFDLVKKSQTPGIVVKADVADPKDKTLTGHDLEVDRKTGDGKASHWIRTINVGKDKVAVLFVEANPLKSPDVNPFKEETFVREPHVLEVGPMLATFMKKNAKPEEAWVRGPTFEMSRGSATVKFDAPKGWEYTRLGPEGSVIWMAPGDSGREYVIALQAMGDATEMRLKIEHDLVERTGGKIFADRHLDKPVAGHEIISSMKLGEDSKWSWRRVYQSGEISISFLAKVPVTDVAVQPDEKIQKEAKTFFESAKVVK